MEFTEEQVISVLTEALTGYLKILDVEHRLQESSQPRQGKGIETAVDITRRQYFRSRTMATQTCLRFASRIASNARKWAGGGENTDEAPETTYTSYETHSVPRVHGDLQEEDEEPYVNPLTGQWIEPRTWKSAGPSNKYDAYAKEEHTMVSDGLRSSFDHVSEVDAILFRASKPIKSAHEIGTTAKSEDNNLPLYPQLESSTSSVTSPNYSRKMIQTFDNLVAKRNTFDDVVNTSNKNSHSSGVAMQSPSRSTASRVYLMDAMSTEYPRLDFDVNYNRPTASKLQAEWAANNDLFEGQLRYAFALDDDIAISQFDFDRLEAQKLQSQFEIEQNYYGNSEETGNSLEAEDLLLLKHTNYAREVLEAEERRSQELSRALQDARNIADEWATQATLAEETTASLMANWEIEKTLLEAQAAFARETAREGDEIRASIQRDMAAARAAQNQWEQEAHALQEQTRRLAEELEREEEEERRRVAAEQAEAENQARERAERARRVAAERQRLERERQEAERKARQADCVSCGDAGEKTNMCILPCTHIYCGECISGAFNSASKSRSPFKCCGSDAPVTLASRWLSASFIGTYELLVLELGTKNPRYCSNRPCHRFIPPQNIQGPIATCPSCSTRTCSSCGQAEHAGICAEDKEGMAVQALAAQKGWKACPSCSAILERTEGCLHMTCRCGGQFCYSCRREWGTCGSTCTRR